MYQIEDEGSEECGAMPSDVDDASALPVQVGRNELDRVLEARVYAEFMAVVVKKRLAMASTVINMAEPE
ncbi:hypothetical protein DAPPUDRAFT_240564 [Daphnia pulex]|uniref:Uncharacterized protein n=1 Tax=Daphnia pulex TaxID=6669 RepID=E9GBV6_DAPPU|nr:hypothetical protein DAPPUDRAFT_240564 [Daphnia pulex]|eukprot:EFX83089.1 hypothetical protein DAPPUDRAFT_240564 [Daphnia pulex]